MLIQRALIASAIVLALSAGARGQTDRVPAVVAPVGLSIAPPPAAAAAAGAKDNGPLLVFHPNQSMTINALIGYVNSQPIYATDLFRPIDDRLQRLAQSSRSVGDFETQAKALLEATLRERVSEALIRSAAESSLTPDEMNRINDLMNIERGKLISSFGGSVSAAEKALKADGSSVAQEMAERKAKFIKEIYFSRFIAHNIEVTQQMARDEYDRDPKRWEQVGQAEVYSITIPISRWLREPSVNGEASPVIANATPAQVQNAESQAAAAARDIIKKLKAGADFAALAEEYNSADENLARGGKWKNPLQKGNLKDTKFEDFIFSIPAKSVGEPYLDHRSDYHDSKAVVVRIGAKTEARKITFVEAQAQIVGDLRRKQLLELESKKMAELAGSAAIEAVERMIDVAVNVAVSRYCTK